MPTLYVSNWSSHATPGAHGPGHKWTIMALPRSWEYGEGAVTLLVPAPENVKARHNAEAREVYSHEQYRLDFLRLVRSRLREKQMGVGPGDLQARTPNGVVPVSHGDTLCCACGVEKARNDRCHRNWAAAILAVAGWDVILDTKALSPEEAKNRLRAMKDQNAA